MEEELVKCATGDRRRVIEGKAKWPIMEAELYRDFLSKRAEGIIVRRGWFRITSKDHFKKFYPEQEEVEFRFSVGWFTGFLCRHRISIQFTTNRAQKIPRDYLNLVIDFFRFIRRNAQVRPGEVEYPTGRYTPSRTANMDQTPAPFEYLSGRTYAKKGSNTVWAKAEKSGWDKRQATIQLTALGDGALLKPWIIFKGKGQLPVAETSRYDTRITTKFNIEGYANEELILEWIQEQLLPVIQRENPLDGPISTVTGLPIRNPILIPPLGLIALDAASFHKTPAVRKALHNANIIPAMIPGGCTTLIQVLDVSVNRPFKDFLKEAMEDELYHLVQIEGEEILSKLDQCNGEEPIIDGVISAVGLRRILLTRAVGTAWERFCKQNHKESIEKAFRRLGLTLPLDGSCDSELSVKGLLSEELVIGDWQQPNASESETTGEEDREDEKEEIDEEEDYNKDVFFVELEGATLQVGRRKKKKEPDQMLATGKPRRQITCSVCKKQGHNKRGCSQRAK